MDSMKPLIDYLNEASRQTSEKDHNVQDMTHRSDEEVIEYFKVLKLSNFDNKSGKTVEEQFYGGITNNIPQNLSRHKIESYIGCVKVDSKETAGRIEQRLHDDLGFDIGDACGGNGASNDTIFVYMASKEPPFVK